MDNKLKVLFLLVLSGLLLGISPVSRLYSADDDPAGTSGPDRIESASVQFILVQIECDTLKELTDESNVLTLDSISLEKIGQCMHAEDGADIVSQSKLMVIVGREAEMTIIENERRKEKNADEGHGEQGRREAEVFVRIEAEDRDGDKLAARFTYRRSVTEEAFATNREAEEEEGNEQKFEVSSGIVLHVGQACIAGANMNEDVATLLIVKADLK